MIYDWAETAQHIPAYLRDEAEPYSLPLVLRVERTNPPTHEEALTIVGTAFMHLFAEVVHTRKDKYDNEYEQWADAFQYWLKGRIRKVARRARGNAWELAKTAPGAFYASQNFNGKLVEILLLPPHPVDEVPEEIRKLQVSGLDLERTPLVTSSQDTGYPELMIAFTDKVHMSTGKAMAQMGHAVQLSIMGSTFDELDAWVDAGVPIVLTGWDDDNNVLVEVRDAGFTEVPPGTVTVKTWYQE